MLPDQNTNAQPETKTEPTATTPEKTGGKVYTESELEQIVKERLTRAQSKAEKQIAEATEKAEAEAAAKNGEWEKLAKANESKLNETLTQLKAKELHDLKRTVAEKVGLPSNLAARLVGETAEEIEADAKALFETLPKPSKPAPGPVITNPGQNATPQNSEQEMLNAIHHGKPNIWELSAMQKAGGGFITPNE